MNKMHNYSSEKQRAIEQMREMNKRATKNSDTKPQTSCTAQSQPANRDLFQNASLPLDSDTLIILALILILAGDNTDKILLLALVYILS